MEDLEFNNSICYYCNKGFFPQQGRAWTNDFPDKLFHPKCLQELRKDPTKNVIQKSPLNPLLRPTKEKPPKVPPRKIYTKGKKANFKAISV